MFDSLKKILCLSKRQLLIKKGLEDGSIIPFDEAFYEQMSHTYVNCIPISMYIKYKLSCNMLTGKCVDKSLFMFFCFEDALLVRTHNCDLELSYNKGEYGWIEMDDYCYDPSLLLKFKKETFYKIYEPYNVSKTTIEEYKNDCLENKKKYEDIKNTKLSDFYPNGKKRIDLCIIIPLLKGLVYNSANPDFEKELDSYLESIYYNEKQVFEEFQSKVKKAVG